MYLHVILFNYLPLKFSFDTAALTVLHLEEEQQGIKMAPKI